MFRQASLRRVPECLPVWLASKGSSANVCRQLPQPVNIENPEILAARVDQLMPLQFRQCPADGLELQPEVVADFLARHLQRKRMSGVAARFPAPRQVGEKGGHPLLGRHGA